VGIRSGSGLLLPAPSFAVRAASEVEPHHSLVAVTEPEVRSPAPPPLLTPTTVLGQPIAVGITSW